MRTYKRSGLPIDGLPGLRRWLDAMRERSADQRGIEVPVSVRNLVEDAKGAEASARNAAKILQHQGAPPP